MITLADTSTTVTLPADMLWDDEFTWQPVEQRVDPTITGGLIVQAATRQAGRPVTLQSGENYAWLTRAQLDVIQTWAAATGKQLTLTIRGTPRTVIFRHQDGPLQAEMVLYHSSPAAGDFYRATIRLLQV